MPWDEVHAEACRLEHAISGRVEERLAAFLGDTTTCPHGHPIPPADGSDPPRPGVPLAQLSTGQHALVYGVTEEVSEIVRYLAEIGLRPGAKVRVLEKAPLGGPLTVSVAEKTHAISLELAQHESVLLPEILEARHHLPLDSRSTRSRLRGCGLPVGGIQTPRSSRTARFIRGTYERTANGGASFPARFYMPVSCISP